MNTLHVRRSGNRVPSKSKTVTRAAFARVIVRICCAITDSTAIGGKAKCQSFVMCMSVT